MPSTRTRNARRRGCNALAELTPSNGIPGQRGRSLLGLASWLDHQDTLEDDEWALLQDTVEQFFGKPLAIAVSRGKLSLVDQPTQSQGFPHQPAEPPAVEPSAFPVIELQKPHDLVNSYGSEIGIEEQPLIVEVEPSALETQDTRLIIEEIIAPEDPSVDEERETPEPSPSQALPDIISLTTHYGFGLEDSAQHIAATITQSQDQTQRPIALRDLTWRLLGEDKVSLAFHLTSYLDTQHPELQPRLPAWLLRAIMLGRHVRHAKGETARFLEMDFARFSSELYRAEQSEWNQALTFLLAAAALQPALLAPQTQAPAVLQALRWEVNLPQFSRYCKSIADYGAHQHPLDPNLLKKGKEQTAWQTETDVLKQAVELWWVRSSRLPLTYTPAAKVWQKWLEPKGMIAALLSPIRHNDASKLVAVKRAVELFADNAQFKREVEHTDRELLGRKLGEDINGRALEQLRLYTREAIGFARRWIELQDIHADQRQGSAQEKAERLRQTILELQGLVQEELSLCKRRLPSPFLLSSIACCRRTLDNLQQLFDSEAPFPTEEPLPRPLLYADLLRIPTVSLNEQWEVEGSDWEALAEGVLDLVANNALKKAAA